MSFQSWMKGRGASGGKPITVVQLARLSKPFGIKPTTIRIGDKTPKGYNIEDCGDTFRRYIPPPTDSEPQHPQQTNNFNDLVPFSEPQQKGNAADQKGTISQRKQSDVADHDPWDQDNDTR